MKKLVFRKKGLKRIRLNYNYIHIMVLYGKEVNWGVNMFIYVNLTLLILLFSFFAYTIKSRYNSRKSKINFFMRELVCFILLIVLLYGKNLFFTVR
jgi:uncharacterized membrane protein SirB2